MITPYLLYEDVAVRFLSKAFGFKKSESAMSGKNGKLTHAAMKLGDDLIMMGYPGTEIQKPKETRRATQILYVNVKDADEHLARAEKAGATILEDPTIRSTDTACNGGRAQPLTSRIERFVALFWGSCGFNKPICRRNWRNIRIAQVTGPGVSFRCNLRYRDFAI